MQGACTDIRDTERWRYAHIATTSLYFGAVQISMRTVSLGYIHEKCPLGHEFQSQLFEFRSHRLMPNECVLTIPLHLTPQLSVASPPLEKCEHVCGFSERTDTTPPPPPPPPPRRLEQFFTSSCPTCNLASRTSERTSPLPIRPKHHNYPKLTYTRLEECKSRSTCRSP